MNLNLDSFEQVKVLLSRIGDRAPTQDDARSIAPALFDIYQRLMRVRVVAPTTDYSQKLWNLLGLVGIPNKSLKRPVEEAPRG